jgi:dihydroorotate dehydrogenase (NAD+) catalytic subunit
VDCDRRRTSEGPSRVDLGASLGRCRLPGAIVASSGCVGFGRELAGFIRLADLGALVTKSVLRAPQVGRPSPRMVETSSGMLNGIGLQGPGVDHLVDVELPWLLAQGARPIVSIAGATATEFEEVAARVADGPPVPAIELNISCPNVERRGQVFATSAATSAEVVSRVRKVVAADQVVLAKLTADVTDIVEIARACVEAGADGLSLINSLLGLAIDTRSLRPMLSGTTGGLTGPAIKPIALRCVWSVHAELPDVPILGGGGVRCGRDAFEFVLAGASAVSVGTANFSNPAACLVIAAELKQELCERGFSRLVDAVGIAHGRAPAPFRIGHAPAVPGVTGR